MADRVITVGTPGPSGPPGPAGTTDYEELDNKPTLGTAAAADVDDFATAAQGSKADTASQPADTAAAVAALDAQLAQVAKSGDGADVDFTGTDFDAVDAQAALIEVRAKLAAGAGGDTTMGLRPPAALAAELDTWLAAYANRSSTPVNVVVLGDSLSTIARPRLTGPSHRPWPLLLARLLGERGPGWRGAYPDADHLCATGSTGTATQNVTAGLGAILDAGEYSFFTVPPAVTARVTWTRTPGGGDLEVRDAAVDGTLLATIDTDGADQSGMITDVALPALWETYGGALYVVASGATATLDGVLFDIGGEVRVWNAARGGWLTSSYTTAPARLDIIEGADPDLVIMALGTNDDSANIAARTEATIAAVRALTSAPIVTVVPPLNSSFPAADAALLRSTATAEGCLIIDLAAILTEYGSSSWLSSDGLHPSRIAHELWAEVVAGVLMGDPIGHAYRSTARAAIAGRARTELNTQTGTSYGVANADMGSTISRANAAASTQTWPSDLASAFVPGDVVRTINRGPGTITHGPAALATVEGDLIQRPGEVSVATKVAANTWHLAGEPERDPIATFAAEALASRTGTPALGTVGTYPDNIGRWALDASTVEAVGSSWQVPEGVTSVDVRVVWAPTSAAAGDVAWALHHRTVTSTSSNFIGAATTEASVITAAPGFSQRRTVTEVATALAVTPGTTLRFAVERDADNASDTYGADVGLVAVTFHPA